MTVSPPPAPPRAVLFSLSGWSAVTVLVDQKIKILA